MASVIYRMVMRLFVLWAVTMIVGHGIDGVDVLFSLKMSLVIFVLHVKPPIFISKSARNHIAVQYLQLYLQILF